MFEIDTNVIKIAIALGTVKWYFVITKKYNKV